MEKTQTNGNVMSTFAEIRNGDMIEELTHELAILVDQVRENNKAGSLTLKLDVKQGEMAPNAFIINDTITVKAPKKKAQPTLMFSDDNFQLSRKDPCQFEMNLEANNKVHKIS